MRAGGAIVAFMLVFSGIASATDLRLVEYEFTLREGVASGDAGAVVRRIAAAHHGVVTRMDPESRHAFLALPASAVDGLASDPLVTSVRASAPGASGRRIEHLTPVKMTASPWSSGAYVYDGAGNIKKIGSDTFAYDGVSRLTSATVRGITQSYTYDAFGNRLTASSLSHGCAGGMDCSITVTTDSASNRVTQATIGTTNYASSYDDAGNMASFAGVSFTYDSLGSMVTRNDGEGP